MLKKYITEFIGTYFLFFTIGCSILINPGGIIAPLAVGSILMVMIYAGAHISGAHYNPAVTLGVWLRRRMPTNDVIPYMAAQILGAALAAFTVLFLKAPMAVTSIELPVLQAFLVEFLFTFALVYVVLNVATSRQTAGNSYYGLAIGFTVLAGAFAVGGVSSAAFNPAVAIGTAIMGLISWQQIWLFFAANFLGGAAAAFGFKYLNPNDQ